MVKRYHESFPSFSYEFDSRYPLQRNNDLQGVLHVALPSRGTRAMSFPFLTPLDPATLRAAGVPERFAFGQADRVRFHELDVLDHVNNARYLSWFETFRVAYLRAYGISDPAVTAPRPVLVLKSVAVDFRAPLHLDDSYIVAGRTRAYRKTSWSMEYAVVSRARLCALSEAVICLMEADFTTRRTLPETYIEAFRSRDGATYDG